MVNRSVRSSEAASKNGGREKGSRHGNTDQWLRPPRVIYVDHVAKRSGGELALLRLLQAMPEVDAMVILAEDGPLAGLLHEAGISVEILPFPQRTRELRKSLVAGGAPLVAMLDTVRYSIKLAVRVRRLRADLVHTNSLKAGVYGLIAAKLARTPVVWHLRDRLEVDYLPSRAIGMVRLLLSGASMVICNSESTRATTMRNSNVVVIPSPIDILPSPRNRAPSEHLVVGMVGRLTPWKGQTVFLQAFAQSFPGGQERAVIVGSAMFGEEDDAYAASLVSLAEALGIASRVEFRGHREDMQAELDRLDVLVHASTIPEPLGQAVIEGMAAGLPVVATAVGGPGELVTDGVDGLLYTPSDVSALSALLRRLAQSPSDRRALGDAALETAQRFYGPRVASETLNVYSTVLAPRGLTAG